MKKYLSVFIFLILSTLVNNVLAQSTIVTETKTWPSVPITVDTTNNTYTVTGTVPTTTTDYYYTYSGYRCFTQKREVVGVNGVIYKASVAGGSDIYCYPE